MGLRFEDCDMMTNEELVKENKKLRKTIRDMAQISRSIIEKVEIMLRNEEVDYDIQECLSNELSAIMYALYLAEGK